MKLQRQLGDIGDAGLVEIVLNRLGVTARQGFGMVMRLAGELVLMVRLDEVRQGIQLQRMKMPTVRMRLQFTIVRVDILGMVMSEHPETEMERPEQDERQCQQRTYFQFSTNHESNSPRKKGVSTLYRCNIGPV